MKYEVGNFGWLAFKNGYILRCGKPVIKTGSVDNWKKYLWLLNTIETEPAYVAYDNMNGKHVSEDLNDFIYWIDALNKELKYFDISVESDNIILFLESIEAREENNHFIVKINGNKEDLGEVVDKDFIEYFNGSIKTLLLPLLRHFKCEDFKQFEY